MSWQDHGKYPNSAAALAYRHGQLSGALSTFHGTRIKVVRTHARDKKVPATVGAPAEEASAGEQAAEPTPTQPLETSTATGPSTEGPTDGPTVVDPSDRHADGTETVKDTSTGDQGENPGMQATPNPQADTTENQASEGAEPRDSNE